MKIKYDKDNFVKFGELHIGEVFYFDLHHYMKIEKQYDDDKLNAIELEERCGYLVHFCNETFVIPVMCELVIK